MIGLNFFDLLIITEQMFSLYPDNKPSEFLECLTVVLVLAIHEILIAEALLLQRVKQVHHRL